MNQEEQNIIVAKELKCREWRGNIIHFTILLESATEDIIALHFCGGVMEKRKEFTHAILGSENFTFYLKWKVLKYIVENFYPETETSHPKFLSIYKSLIQFRNDVAHAKFLSMDDRNKGNDGIIYLENKTTNQSRIDSDFIALSNEIMVQKLNEMSAVRNALLEIQDKMGFERKTETNIK